MHPLHHLHCSLQVVVAAAAAAAVAEPQEGLECSIQKLHLSFNNPVSP